MPTEILKLLSLALLSSTASLMFALLIRRLIGRWFGAHAAYTIWVSAPIFFSLPFIMAALPYERGDPDLVLWQGPLTKAESGPFDPTNIFHIPPEQAVSFSSHIILFVWGSGVIIWLLGQVYRQTRYETYLKQTSYAPSSKLNLYAAEIANHLALKTPPSLLISRYAKGPLVTHILRPTIYVPLHFERDYNEQEQYWILLHEMVHIRRGDLWITLFVLLFRALHWPVPFAAFCYRAFRSDQEAACDLDVLKATGDADKAYEYGCTLARVATLFSTPRSLPLSLFAATSLKERLSLLNKHGSKYVSLIISTFTILLACGSTLLFRDTPSNAIPVHLVSGVDHLSGFFSSAAARDDREIFILEFSHQANAVQTITLFDVGDVAHLDDLKLSEEEIRRVHACNLSAPVGQNVDAILVRHASLSPSVHCIVGREAGNLHRRIMTIYQVIAAAYAAHPILPSLRRQIMLEL